MTDYGGWGEKKEQLHGTEIYVIFLIRHFFPAILPLIS